MKYDLSEINGVIKDRRTIYPEQYSERIVQKEMVEQLLNNAIWAPTHGKTQPWRFKVYSGEGRVKLLDHLRKLYTEYTPEEEFNKHKLARIESRIEKTSVLILMIMSRTENTKIPKSEEIQAVACAAQNMLLTATAYGLGSYWSSPKYLSTPEANETFGLKPEDFIQGLLYLGYPNSEWPKSHRRPIEYVTEWID